MNEKILVVDDEPDIVSLIRDYLEINNYEIITASNGCDAIEKLALHPDLILLDINMPEMDGIEVCKKIRGTVNCPIIFLTARTQSDDIITGLSMGADDYITKPFNIRELTVRVEAHLRREKRYSNYNAPFADGVVINYNEMAVYYNGQDLGFTKKEFEIIELLSLNPGQVFDREAIYEKIWGFDAEGYNNVVTEHIRKIRSKFAGSSAPDCINTVWGVGYKWAK